MGEAISPDEFSRVKTGTIEEIVYEVKEDEPPYNIYTNTARGRPSQQVSSPIPFSQYRPPQLQLATPASPKVYTSQVQAPLSMQPSYSPRTNFTHQRTSEIIRSPHNPGQGNNSSIALKQSSGPSKTIFNNYQSTALQTATSQEFIREQVPANSSRSVFLNGQPS